MPSPVRLLRLLAGELCKTQGVSEPTYRLFLCSPCQTTLWIHRHESNVDRDPSRERMRMPFRDTLGEYVGPVMVSGPLMGALLERERHVRDGHKERIGLADHQIQIFCRPYDAKIKDWSNGDDNNVAYSSSSRSMVAIDGDYNERNSTLSLSATCGRQTGGSGETPLSA